MLSGPPHRITLRRQSPQIGGELLAVVGGAQIRNGHRHELFTGITVTIDHSLIHGEEMQGVAIHHPHRYRAALEQQPE
jgi:hypothetical protein